METEVKRDCLKASSYCFCEAALSRPSSLALSRIHCHSIRPLGDADPEIGTQQQQQHLSVRQSDFFSPSQLYGHSLITAPCRESSDMPLFHNRKSGGLEENVSAG